jgi:hypothetical protein
MPKDKPRRYQTEDKDDAVVLKAAGYLFPHQYAPDEPVRIMRLPDGRFVPVLAKLPDEEK